MKAAIYARVSTFDQEPENQLAELRRYVDARGWPATAYVDKGVSGAKDKRPALDDLVRDARRRRFDVLVVWRLDRLGRNLRHLILLLDELTAVGIAFVSLGEGIDTATPAGRLQLHILGAIADYAVRDVMKSNGAGGRVLSALLRCRAPHHPTSCSDAMSASGALKRPRRNAGGNTCSMASSFSEGSTRK
jgi:Resolvase, N terminal domain